VVPDFELPVPVSQLWDALPDLRYDLILDTTWVCCLKQASGTDAIGELHLKGDAQPDDFMSVPIDRPLKMLMMQPLQEQGFIVRWGDTEQKKMESVLGGFLHEHLLRGDSPQFEAVRYGVMQFDGSGSLRVW
jgi:hypothetical protein